jgi:large subunit ribosomal protein L24
MISAARKKTHVKSGDQVTVITGAHKGASGKVITVLTKKDQVIVEGVRMIKKHARKSQDRPQGGIIEREGPIHISNVKKVESASVEDKKAAHKSKNPS